MATEGRHKRKVTDNASNTTATPKRAKVTASIDVDQTNHDKSPSPTTYQATVQSEEEQAAHGDTIIIDSDDDGDNAKQSSADEAAESSDAELGTVVSSLNFS